MIKLGELVMILDCIVKVCRSAPSPGNLVSTGRQSGPTSPKGWSRRSTKSGAPRPGIVDHFVTYLRERLAAYPALTAVRLWRELKERGFASGYSVVRDRVRELRPSRPAGFEVRFETPAGEQAQVDFARFEVEFVDEPGSSASSGCSATHG